MKQRRRIPESVSKINGRGSESGVNAEAGEIHPEAAEKTLVFLRSSVKTAASNFIKIQSRDAP
jgi:hypothetical protein